MKWVVLILVFGLIPLYFLGAAFKLHLLTAEMSTHLAIRFFAGFIILGVIVFYERLVKFKHSIIILFALVLADDIADYFRDVNSFKFEMFIMDGFMLLWGAFAGFVFIKQIKKYNQNQ
jgi:hypothetical protein